MIAVNMEAVDDSVSTPLLSDDPVDFTQTDDAKVKLSSVEDVSSLDDSDQSSGPFRSLCVMELSKGASQETVEFLMSKIKSSRRSGGCGLLVTKVPHDGAETVLHIGASNHRLLLAAELMELKKLTITDHTLREFSLQDQHLFVENEEDTINLLTLSEKQRIIIHELELIRAQASDQFIPGFRKMHLYVGETIVPRCTKEGIIKCIFPLHDKRALKKLSSDWWKKPLGVQPIGDIQAYFGDTIAMYFSFLGFYTMALIPPAFVGVMSSLLSSGSSTNTFIFFSVFNLVWATIFLEAWKRCCATLAYKWGTINTEDFEEARADYHGELVVNKVTGRLEPHYSKKKRMAKYYLVSLPVVCFSLWLAFMVMLAYFWFQHWAEDYNKASPGIISSLVLYLPSTLYAVVIGVMNTIYRKIAKALNDWENHRLQSAYDNHLIVKLVLFDFVNCFMSLFYVAFYLQDMQLLQSHLALLLIVQQAIGQICEALVPYLMYKRSKKQIKKHFCHDKSTCDDSEKSGVERVLNTDEVAEHVLLQAEIESAKPTYDEGTLDDYLEMFLQFGYVFLFSSVFPLAALWALINNATEIRSDGFKLCRILQRPFAQPTSNIGAWQVAFELMSVTAVITNCALIAMSPQVQQYVPTYGGVTVVVAVVIAEHGVLFLKSMLAYMIPDTPDWVETEVARAAYQSKKAWRKQRSEEARLLKTAKQSAKDKLDME